MINVIILQTHTCIRIGGCLGNAELGRELSTASGTSLIGSRWRMPCATLMRQVLNAFAVASVNFGVVIESKTMYAKNTLCECVLLCHFSMGIISQDTHFCFVRL